MNALHLKTFFPICCTGGHVSHICMSLCRDLRDENVSAEMIVPVTTPGGRAPFVRSAIPDFLRDLSYRIDRHIPWMQRHAERTFLRQLRPGDIAWVWPGASLELYRRIKDRGHCLVVERINCHRATSKRILDDAYRRMGLEPRHEITAESVEIEREELALADYIFAPSPPVYQSLRDDGIAPEKILATSYGWEPGRFAGTDRALPPVDGVTVLFVGRLCVRKGVHLLLETWAAAGINGRLVLLGDMTDDIAQHCAAHLGRADVIHLPSRQNVAPIYRSADFFAFPTLEEGSPLVLYEAMASGLPSIVSPMAAGEVALVDRTALVLEPYARDAWIAAFRRLAADLDLRRTLGAAARTRAEAFTWEKVARHRRAQLQAAVAPRAAGAKAGAETSASVSSPLFDANG